MPKGIIWLIVGLVVGAALGWLLVADPVVGGAAGFVITFALLVIGSWLGGRGSDEASISGR